MAHFSNNAIGRIRKSVLWTEAQRPNAAGPSNTPIRRGNSVQLPFVQVSAIHANYLETQPLTVQTDGSYAVDAQADPIHVALPIELQAETYDGNTLTDPLGSNSTLSFDYSNGSQQRTVTIGDYDQKQRIIPWYTIGSRIMCLPLVKAFTSGQTTVTCTCIDANIDARAWAQIYE